MTIDDFINMSNDDLAHLTKKENREEAKSILCQMAGYANRRLKNLSKLDIPSPAFMNRAIRNYESQGYVDKEIDYDVARDEDGNFKYRKFQSTGLDDLREIRRELKFVRSFLSSQTSTVKGAKDYTIDMMKRVGGYNSKKEAEENKWTYEQSKVIWEAYSRLEESDFNLVHNEVGTNEVQEIIANIYQPGMSVDELYQRARDALREQVDREKREEYYRTHQGTKNKFYKV